MDLNTSSESFQVNNGKKIIFTQCIGGWNFAAGAGSKIFLITWLILTLEAQLGKWAVLPCDLDLGHRTLPVWKLEKLSQLNLSLAKLLCMMITTGKSKTLWTKFYASISVTGGHIDSGSS